MTAAGLSHQKLVVETNEYATNKDQHHCDNYKRWCDVVTNLANDQTGLTINTEYYNEGKRAYQREKQLATYSVKNAKGRNIAVTFTAAEGNDLHCNIVIG